MATSVPFYDKPKGVGYFFSYEFESDGRPKDIKFYEGTTVLEDFEDFFSYRIEAGTMLQGIMEKQYKSMGLAVDRIELYAHPADIDIDEKKQTILLNYAYQARTITALSPDWSRHQSRTKSVVDVQRKITDIKAYFTAVKNVALTRQRTGAPVKKAGAAPEPERRKLPSKLEILQNKYKLPTIEDDGFYVTEETWYYTLRSIDRKQNMLYAGPTGCGKTALVKLALKRMDKPYKKLNMAAMQDALTGLIGQHILRDGQSTFQYAPFYHYIQGPNGILLDELSRGPANANNILFTCLDDSRELHADISHDTHVIPVHPEANFMATANLGVEYTGAYQLDRALIDRFALHEIGYMDADTEAKVLIKRTEVDSAAATLIAKVADSTRVLKKKDELSDCVSPRLTLEAAELVVDGFPIDTAMKLKFLPLFEGDSETGDRGSVKKLIIDSLPKGTKAATWS